MQTRVETKAQVFSLKTPLVEKGMINNVVAETDLMWAWVKVYAEGGENYLHQHTVEDHMFVILDGQATFHDQAGKDTVLGKWQGILLPRGTYYSFTSTGDGPLVMLRVGATTSTKGYYDDREFPPGVVDNRDVSPQAQVLIPGKFFGDPDSAT
jgi:mannose-6-phosphate isomerase-like protein (cupin superfamily)